MKADSKEDLRAPRRPALGYAFLDNSALWQLRRAEIRDRLWERLEYRGMTLMLTELNVLQALAAGPVRGRELLEILTGVARSQWVLPAPDAFLRDAITQVTSATISLSAELFELRRADAIEDFEAEARRAKAWTARADAAYRDHLRQHQASIRQGLRARGVRPTIDLLPAFNADWPSMRNYGELRQHLWTLLGFASDAPDALEQRLPPLRIELAAQGVGLFEHAIAYDAGKPTERTDLLQLCYLGMSQYALLVTNDHGQQRAANTILQLPGFEGMALSLDQLLAPTGDKLPRPSQQGAQGARDGEL